MVLISAIAMPALFLCATQAVLFFVLVAVVYWCYGTQLSVFASTTADFYGTKNLGLNYGVLFTAWGAAGILGPDRSADGSSTVRRLPIRVLRGGRAQRCRVRRTDPGPLETPYSCSPNRLMSSGPSRRTTGPFP